MFMVHVTIHLSIVSLSARVDATDKISVVTTTQARSDVQWLLCAGPMLGASAENWCPPRQSMRCLLWRRRRCLPAGGAKVKNCQKCLGPCFNTARCTSPSMAMSRRVASGARPKCTRAPTSDMPTCLERFSRNRSNPRSTVVAAW